ncbi:MAG: PAS-domain containing protein [Rhizobiaceae bacterium]|nr:PAS-domain containing protein [Rhizobiaceae bacterium]
MQDDYGALFSARELGQLVETGTDWVWQTDSRHCFTYFSPGVAAATGLRAQRALGKCWFDFFANNARDSGAFERHRADLAAHRPFREFVYEVAKATDNCRYISVSGFPRFDEDGRFAGYTGSGRNVTQTMEALDELREARRALSLKQSRERLVHDAEAGRSHAERMMAALNAMHDAFCYYDTDDRLVLYNDAMVDMYAGLEDVIRPGCTFATLIEAGLERGIFVTGDVSREDWRDHVLGKRRDGGHWEQVIAFADGRYAMHREIRDDEGGTIGICTDVTEMKLGEAALARAKAVSDDAYSDLVRTIDSMRMGVVLLDASMSAEIISRAFFDIWKLQPGQVAVGSHFRALMDVNRSNGIYDVPDDKWEGYVAARLSEIAAGDVAPREFRRADGCVMIYSVTALSGGKRLVTYYDITDQKRRETELAAALEKTRLAEAVINSVPDPIFVKDENLDFVLVNQGFANFFDRKPSEMMGRKGGDFVTPKEAVEFEASERAVLETGVPYEVEEDFEFHDAPMARIVRKNRVTLPGGKSFVACTIFDVTEMKRRAQEASEARAQLETVLESLPAGVIIYDRDNRFVYANRKTMQNMTALADAMQPGRTLREALEAGHAAGYFRTSDDDRVDGLYDTDREAWIDAFIRKYDAPHAVYERQNADGSWMQVFDTRTPEGFFVGVRVDITEIKQREAALQETQRQNEVFQNLIDNVPVAIYAKRPDLRLMYVNKGWTDLTGHSKEFAIGKTDVEIFGGDGEAYRDGDLAVLQSRDMVEVEEIGTNPDGSQRHQIARKSAMMANDGTLYLIGSTTDVTELKRREAELEEARRKAILADRAKSEFLANMSHEIRTPMNGVLGMAELMARTELDGKQRTFVDIIVKSGNALLTIINDILDFSKIDAGQLVLDPAPFNLAEAIEDVATLVSTRAKEKDLELIVRLQPGLHHTFIGDVGRIRQIITNLMGNAVKFTDKGHVLVEVTGEDTAEGGSSRLKVAVTDTGIGIPADKLQLVFEKFSQVDASSTRRHEGTGLGLAITSRLVELMQGNLGVDSVEGEGSTFWFALELPRSGPSNAERITPMDVTGARVLVVDDNAVNRAILSEQMASWGFDACAAEDGRTGIEVLRAAAMHKIAVDCVVLDFQMPGMTGVEMARIVRSTPSIADVPIVMLTSVDQSLVNSQHRDLALDAQLIKPVRSSLLLETLVTAIQRHRMRVAPPSPVLPAAAPQRSAETSAVVPATAVPAPTPTQSAPKVSSGRRLDLLVAEDNEVNQLVFTQILADTGLTFQVVGNGRLAVAAWREMQPGMILMDVSMPEMNGLEATGAIRAEEAATGARTPIVGVTAHALKGDRERCIEAGMDDYLSKPISPKALLDKISAWMGESGAMQRAG